MTIPANYSTAELVSHILYVIKTIYIVAFYLKFIRPRNWLI